MVFVCSDQESTQSADASYRATRSVVKDNQSRNLAKHTFRNRTVCFQKRKSELRNNRVHFSLAQMPTEVFGETVALLPSSVLMLLIGLFSVVLRVFCGHITRSFFP